MNSQVALTTRRPNASNHFTHGQMRRPAPALSLSLGLGLGLAFACLAAPATVHADEDDERQQSRAPELPSTICDGVNVPAGQRVSAHFYAFGVQIYRWSGTNWAFVAPEATLYADPCYDATVGIHYAGPTWECRDGSKVTGARLDGCTPNRGAIPWLRLAATPAAKPGRLSRTTYIQRINTVGGTAPAEAGQSVGEEARVPYTAEYYFYRSKNR